MNDDPGATSVAPEDRRQHLQFIQATIARMASASSTAKGWLLPVVTAAFGLALTQKSGSVALLGIAAVVVFAYIDANYLRQEKAFRRLYDAVAAAVPEVPGYCMSTSHVTPSTVVASDIRDSSRLQRLWSRVRGWFPEQEVWLSWSIAPFYGTLLAVGLVALACALIR